MLRKKAGMLMMMALLVVCLTLMFAQFAFATVVSGGETGPQSGGSSGGTSGTGASTTGAPLLAVGAASAAMIGAGYLLKRKSGK